MQAVEAEETLQLRAVVSELRERRIESGLRRMESGLRLWEARGI